MRASTFRQSFLLTSRCPYCQKVWLQLEEKEIPYTVEKVNMRCYGSKSPDYLAKVPSGLLPAMELDGIMTTESADIMQLLEDKFSQSRRLLPLKGTPERARADELLKLERQLFSDWLQWLCSNRNPDAAKRRFMDRMTEIDQQLGKDRGPFFLKEGFSLVDIVFAPFLERIAASIPYYKGVIVRGNGHWKNLEAWFDAMEARPAYLATKSDHYTHVHDLPPQLGGCSALPEARELAAAIDGVDGRSWHLPLPRLSATSKPEAFYPGENPEQDRLQAAAKLVGNHTAIVKFAARSHGRQPFSASAPLSDPLAEPGSDLDAIDAGLRWTANALLRGTDACSLEFSGSLSGSKAILAAAYLRDRIGVPRDLHLPAARQLRAHLNWLIDALQKT